MTAIFTHSLTKIALVGVVVLGLSYLSVTPHTLPLELYNAQWQSNFLRACIPVLTAAATLAMVAMATMTTKIDVNNVIHLFTVSFTVEHVIVFVLEVVLATDRRNVVAGKSVTVRVVCVGGRGGKKKKK